MQFSLGPALWGAQQTGHVTCLHKQRGAKGYVHPTHSPTHIHTQSKSTYTQSGSIRTHHTSPSFLSVRLHYTVLLVYQLHTVVP